MLARAWSPPRLINTYPQVGTRKKKEPNLIESNALTKGLFIFSVLDCGERLLSPDPLYYYNLVSFRKFRAY
jgi:hypothetical protein